MKPFWRGEEGLRLASPAVDIVEGEKAYEVMAELPGMDDKDIEVTLMDDVLTIRGEKREEKEEKGKNIVSASATMGAFERSFEAPDADKIEARFEKGRPESHASEEAGGAEEGKEDRGQDGLSQRAAPRSLAASSLALKRKEQAAGLAIGRGSRGERCHE